MDLIPKMVVIPEWIWWAGKLILLDFDDIAKPIFDKNLVKYEITTPSKKNLLARGSPSGTGKG